MPWTFDDYVRSLVHSDNPKWVRDKLKELLDNQAQIEMDKLHLEQDDILVLKVPADFSSEKALEFLQRAKTYLRGITVVILHEGTSLETLREDDMNAAGWFRNPGDDTCVMCLQGGASTIHRECM